MKKTITVFIASAILLITLCAPVMAAEENEGYICDITVAIWTEKNDVKNPEMQLAVDGFTVISENRVFIGFKKTDDVSQAITGIKFLYGSTEDILVIDGVKYSRVFTARRTDIEQTINLFITTDKRAGTPIIALTADLTKNPDGWYTVCADDGTRAASFGETEKNEAIYLHYKRVADYTGSAFSTPMLMGIIITSAVIVFSAVTISIIAANKKNIRRRWMF